MTGIYSQKGPRAHHFVAMVSIAVGLSIFFEYYATNVIFSSLDGFTPLSGQHLWGTMFFVLGVLLLQRWSIIVRACLATILCFLWTIIGLYSMYVSLFGAQAKDVGSVFGILSLAMAGVCILATSNLRRDFYVTRKQWFKQNPLAELLDPHRPKGGDSNRE